MPQNACTTGFWNDGTRGAKMRVAVISLKRTPERWHAFLQRNHQTLGSCELLRIDGIDGSELLHNTIKTRLIAPSAHQNWSAGAVGIGLSHLLCWRLCCNSSAPLVVFEDDVVLADGWHQQLEQLLNPSAGMVLLGWNLDSLLRAEFSQQQEMISLFEPAYPSEKALNAIVNSKDIRQLKRLRNAFGLPGYWLTPAMARRLLTTIQRLETMPLRLGRGLPEITTLGIDALLNLHYHQLESGVVMPPLALALNNPCTSLTRSGPNQFDETDS